MRTVKAPLIVCIALLLGVLSATPGSLRAAATITVTSTDDSGAGTLRQALAGASDGDTIDATGAFLRVAHVEIALQRIAGRTAYQEPQTP